jgi:hypothetical protein
MVIQSLLLVVIYYHYNTKKQESRRLLSDLEESSSCNLSSENPPTLGQANHVASPRKSGIAKFIDGNLIKGAERRLTIPNHKGGSDTHLSQENLKRLRNAYKHPFAKVSHECLKRYIDTG